MSTQIDWGKVARKIDSSLTGVHLLCDGYVVSLHNTRIKRRVVVVILVDGQVKKEWMTIRAEGDGKAIPEPPESRLLPLRSKAKFSGRELKMLELGVGKRECRRLGFYDRVEYRDFTFRTPGGAIRHIKKAATDIHWLCQGDVR